MSTVEKLVDVDYSPQEERAAVRKVDFKVLPVIVLCFLMLQYDRTNLGNAQTDNFSTAIGITTSDINTGQTLFTLGIVLLELPSNIVAKALGPQRWIPSIIFLWGIITFCQAFITGQSGFFATRFLLAAGEAGFIPGMAWYMTRFYTAGELSLRFAIFWSANNIAGMTSGPLALGILGGLTGKAGWHGWQYLFLIGESPHQKLDLPINRAEGLMTVFASIIAILWLPSSPMDGGRSLIGQVVMSSRDAEVLAARVIRDDPKKAFARGTRVKLVDVKDTFSEWRLYGHCAAALLSSIIFTPINTYGPSVIKSLGYTGYTANGMAAPGAAVALVVSIGLAYSSDRFKERGLHIATVMFLTFVGCFWLAFASSDVAKQVLYGGYVLTAGTMGTGQAIHASWVSSRFDERRRPIALACYVMSIQMAGFAGANVFQSADAPRYTKGFAACGVCSLAAGIIVLIWKFIYAREAKRQPEVVEPASALVLNITGNPASSKDSINEKSVVV